MLTSNFKIAGDEKIIGRENNGVTLNIVVMANNTIIYHNRHMDKEIHLNEIKFAIHNLMKERFPLKAELEGSYFE